MWNYKLSLKFRAKIKEQFVTYDINHANEQVTAIVPLFSNPKNNSPQSVRSLHFTLPHKLMLEAGNLKWKCFFAFNSWTFIDLKFDIVCNISICMEFLGIHIHKMKITVKPPSLTTSLLYDYLQHLTDI